MAQKLIANEEPNLVDDQQNPPADPNTDPGEDPNTDPAGQNDDDDDDGADSLGDPGKKALDRMKAERNEAKKAARERDAEIAELKRQIEAKDKTPEENELEAARVEARAETLSKANERVLRSEVKSAAAGKLRNPADALKLLDLKDFDVNEDGDVDTDQIQDAISDLLEEKPYLAAQGSNGSFDSGRGKQPRKKKLTKADLAGMSPNEIAKAYDEGRVES
ncbi:scaffolding protein [Brevibacterium phage 4C]|uniref:Scaffolding protein n=29 Tax=Agmunavirus AGM1 TaxID=2843882 RepID=A0A7D0GIY1_9CAUD|nr:head scaffolding protein [Brevibacterium phage AGM1]QDH85648.1 scaffolding protein [Brevibacterium phage AGM2]QDH85701.1 scaffolding protein [Brevibacterium phage AGM3]QDH85807.1 scaffolding protein [Brevibacterium phage AGM5]QDH85860.1 scaffolding protein [Brevibacterium phage AGM6]QDH85913.1 scaffolding protein [Brevibacterium phage AGM7]QDH85966.1 scaffolding protein [Brevibacterium phage AGM8]QDH86019.1 scaffolding protein [Brevibacterium phage AGM9]QDH86072.1 scaffolding protein [Br